MAWPRWTTRRLMIAVLGLAVVLGLAIPAVEVYREKGRHSHAYVGLFQGQVVTTWNANYQTPFWPRYVRSVLGQPWKGQPVCGRGSGQLAETCEPAHPEILIPYSPGRFSHRPTPEMRAAVERLTAEIAGPK